MNRKIRTDAPSLADLHAAVELDPRERREGLWAKLELIRMNERFAVAMPRARGADRRRAGSGGGEPAAATEAVRRIGAEPQAPRARARRTGEA